MNIHESIQPQTDDILSQFPYSAEYFKELRDTTASTFVEQENRYDQITQDPVFEALPEIADAAKAGIVYERSLVTSELIVSTDPYDELFIAYEALAIQAKDAENATKAQLEAESARIKLVAARAIELSPNSAAKIHQIVEERHSTSVLNGDSPITEEMTALSAVYAEAGKVWTVPRRLDIAQDDLQNAGTAVGEPVNDSNSNDAQTETRKLKELSGNPLLIFNALTETAGCAFTNAELATIVYGNGLGYEALDNVLKQSEINTKIASALNPKNISKALLRALSEQGLVFQYGTRHFYDTPEETGAKTSKSLRCYRALPLTGDYAAEEFEEIIYDSTGNLLANPYESDELPESVKNVHDPEVEREASRTKQARELLSNQPDIKRNVRKILCKQVASYGDGEEQ